MAGQGKGRPVRALNYYGSKVQSAHKYPAPNHPLIVEPFAWLPFVPHHSHASAPTADVKGRHVSTELIWTNGQ